MKPHNCRSLLCETDHVQEPPETGYSMDTIPITCPEDNTKAVGVNAMFSHIIEFHKDYDPPEAMRHAKLWAEEAFEQEEQNILDYYAVRRNEDRDD